MRKYLLFAIFLVIIFNINISYAAIPCADFVSGCYGGDWCDCSEFGIGNDPLDCCSCNCNAGCGGSCGGGCSVPEWGCECPGSCIETGISCNGASKFQHCDNCPGFDIESCTWGCWNGACNGNPCTCGPAAGYEGNGGGCGQCGTLQQYCDGCSLGGWECRGEGECASGAVDTSNGACGTCGTQSSRTCTGSCGWGAWSCSNDNPPAGYGNNCNCNACGSCGGTIDCGGSCSGSTPANPAGYGDACGNCGTKNCALNCVGEGVCAPTTVSGCDAANNYIVCSSGCQWADQGTNADADAKDFQCGDSLCDNAAGVYDATKTVTEITCNDLLDNDCDGLRDGADPDCVGLPCPGGTICCLVAGTCAQDDCVIETCVANSCTFANRPLGTGTECAQTGIQGTSSYCNAAGGDCKFADEDSNVCASNAITDTTAADWQSTASGPTKDRMIDNGKGYGANLFDSIAAPCDANSCTEGTDCACRAKESSLIPVATLPAIGTGNCCGDDPNEYYKPDYFGPECVSSPDACVWSSGKSQPLHSGNRRWWCNPGDWYECTDSTIGSHDPPEGMCCAGNVGSPIWTPNAEVLGENSYSCTDGKDNDCDGYTDCDDTDCAGSIGGYVRNQDNNAIFGANFVLKKISSQVNQSTMSDSAGKYNFTVVKCGTWNIDVSHFDYWPISNYNAVLNPAENKRIDFSMLVGTSCESDCTYVVDDNIHASCDGHAGCTFYDDTAKLACDNAHPGWLRDYNETHYVICPSGTPQPKIEIQSSLTCSSGTLVKVTRIVVYNGKPVRLVVATCG